MTREQEWHPRTFFAEMAETLEVSTDCIMAASTQDDLWWVLYTETPETDDDSWIHVAVLERDERNILGIRRELVLIQMRDFHGQFNELMRQVQA